jgi:hypothetical protein
MHRVRRELLSRQSQAAVPALGRGRDPGRMLQRRLRAARMGQALAEAPLAEAQTSAVGNLFLAETGAALAVCRIAAMHRHLCLPDPGRRERAGPLVRETAAFTDARHCSVAWEAEARRRSEVSSWGVDYGPRRPPLVCRRPVVVLRLASNLPSSTMPGSRDHPFGSARAELGYESNWTRNVSAEHPDDSRELADRGRTSAGRGRWYADSYGAAAERWWDGTKWTHYVRSRPPVEATASARHPYDPGSRPSSRSPSEAPRTRPSEIADVTTSMALAHGDGLKLVPKGPKRSGHFELVKRDDRVGMLVVPGDRGIVRMICAEGGFDLTKARRLGWELLIESVDGQQVGSFSGRRWLPGGTISLTDGTQVDLRRSPRGRWNLKATDSGQRLVDFRTGVLAAPRIAISVHSPPGGLGRGGLVVLTACAVLTLDYRLRFLVLSSAQ